MFLICAQNSVPNGSFENWTTITSSHPTNYDFNSNRDDMGVFNINKTTGYTGNYGVELKTVSADGIRMAYLLNENPPSQDPSTWHGGIPCTQIPTGIQGFYKYNQASGDQGMVIVTFSKNGTNIGVYSANLGGLHTEYTPFNLSFSPALAQTPDSVIIAFASSGFSGAVVGSTLVVDNISFTGVASQPALMNGDFEQWTAVVMESLNDWLNHNYDDNQMKKTTDAFKGNFALELKTFVGEQNDRPKAQSGHTMTGYYNDNCGGNCYPQGGYPFTNQTDVLEFYYKYQPVGNDQGEVNLYFKKKNSGQDAWYANAFLPATSQYTFVEVPINLQFVPDTVIIQFMSSRGDLVSMSNIGSTLKIDEVYFRSQKTGLYNLITKEITIFPNPVDKTFNLPNNLSIDKITISDIRGAKVMSIKNVSYQVDVSTLQKGIYIVMIETKDGIYKGKLLKK